MEGEKWETDTKENKKTKNKNKNKKNIPITIQTQTETAMRYLPGGKSSWGWIRAVKRKNQAEKKRQASNILIRINK